MLCFGTQQRNEASMWIAKLTLHYGSGLVFLQYGKLWLCPHSLTKHYMACRTSVTGGLMESSFKGSADTLILVARTLLCCFYANFCTKTSLLACTVPTYLSDMTKQQLEAAACCRRQPSLAVFLLACWVWSHCTGKRANSPVSFLVRRGHAHIPSLFGYRRLPDWRTHWPFQLLETQCSVSASHFLPLSRVALWQQQQTPSKQYVGVHRTTVGYSCSAPLRVKTTVF